MRRTEVQHIQFALRFQYTVNLFERAALVVGDEMVNDKAGDHPVKSRIRIREGRGESFIPLNFYTASFLPRDVQHFRVAIQTCDLRFGMGALEHKRQRACATAKIKDSHLRLDVCLLNQFAFEGFLPHDPFEQGIIQRRKPAKTQCGDIAFLIGGLAHVHFFLPNF